MTMPTLHHRSRSYQQTTAKNASTRPSGFGASSSSSSSSTYGVLLRQWQPCQQSGTVLDYLQKAHFPTSFRPLCLQQKAMGRPDEAIAGLDDGTSLEEAAAQEEAISLMAICTDAPRSLDQFLTFFTRYSTIAAEFSLSKSEQAHEYALNLRFAIDHTRRALLTALELDRSQCIKHADHDCLGRRLWGPAYSLDIAELWKVLAKHQEERGYLPHSPPLSSAYSSTGQLPLSPPEEVLAATAGLGLSPVLQPPIDMGQLFRRPAVDYGLITPSESGASFDDDLRAPTEKKLCMASSSACDLPSMAAVRKRRQRRAMTALDPKTLPLFVSPPDWSSMALDNSDSHAENAWLISVRSEEEEESNEAADMVPAPDLVTASPDETQEQDPALPLPAESEKMLEMRRKEHNRAKSKRHRDRMIVQRQLMQDVIGYLQRSSKLATSHFSSSSSRVGQAIHKILFPTIDSECTSKDTESAAGQGDDEVMLLLDSVSASIKGCSTSKRDSYGQKSKAFQRDQEIRQFTQLHRITKLLGEQGINPIWILDTIYPLRLPELTPITATLREEEDETNDELEEVCRILLHFRPHWDVLLDAEARLHTCVAKQRQSSRPIAELLNRFASIIGIVDSPVQPFFGEMDSESEGGTSSSSDVM